MLRRLVQVYRRLVEIKVRTDQEEHRLLECKERIRMTVCEFPGVVVPQFGTPPDVLLRLVVLTGKASDLDQTGIAVPE